jgi:hypothetical protein
MSQSVPVSVIAPSEIHTDGTHTSVLLHRLIKEAPADYFTLDWLIGHLPNRSYGVILLFLALIAILPVISFPARMLIIVFAAEILAGCKKPALPHRLMMRRLPSRHLALLEHRAIPLLEHLEKIVRPRWPFVLLKARRFTAFLGLLLTFLSLAAPLPFSNIPPSLICVLMALAYIEHDGFMLVCALTAAIILLAFVAIFCLQSFMP